MHFKLQIHAEDAAFAAFTPAPEPPELARLLRQTADLLEAGTAAAAGALYDADGNRVGRWVRS